MANPVVPVRAVGCRVEPVAAARWAGEVKAERWEVRQVPTAARVPLRCSARRMKTRYPWSYRILVSMAVAALAKPELAGCRCHFVRSALTGACS